MTSIETKCEIFASDNPYQIAKKISLWVERKIPDETPSHKADQALLAWNAVRINRGFRSFEAFYQVFKGAGRQARERQLRRFTS